MYTKTIEHALSNFTLTCALNIRYRSKKSDRLEFKIPVSAVNGNGAVHDQFLFHKK